MKKFMYVLFAFLLAFGLAAGAASKVSAAAICVDPANTPTCYATIQEAVNAAASGDTITVAAGTYAERITIDKPLILTGVGTPVIDAAGFGTPGYVVNITALTGDTTVQGFEIRTGDWSTGFHSSGGTDAAGHINILDNHIVSTNSDLSGEQYGVIAGYLDVRHLIISCNTISNTYDNSILVELQMGATDITGNSLDGAFPSIFFMTYDGHDVSQPQVVSGNTIDMSSAEVGSGAAGIAFNPSTHFVTVDRRTGKYSSVEISNNTITGLSDISIKGISVGESSADGIAGGVTDLNIFGNTISGTNGKGIQLFSHITGADIHDNIISGLAQGIRIFSYQSTFFPENNDVHDNQITGASAYLINYEGVAPIDLSENWWGTGDGATIAAKMTAGVDFSPWCSDSACTAFLDVSPGYSSIQAAINAADPGDTIHVAAGTYNEVLSIYKSLTLVGAGEGSTIINASASGGYGMDIMANNVTLNNFTFVGPSSNASGRYGIKVSGPSAPTKGTNFTISDVTIQDSGRTGLDINGMNGVTITDVTATNTNATNKANGVALTDVDNATLTNITTSGNNWGGVAIYTYGRYYTLGSSNVTVSGLTASEGNPLYIQTGNYSDPAHPSAVVGFSAPQFGFAVHNLDAALVNYTWFQETEPEAIAFALALTPANKSYVIDLSDGSLVLAPGMSIQAAVDAADPGDTINVPAGTFIEQVTISKSLTLVGEDRDTTIIKAPATIPVASDQNSYVVKIAGSGVDVDLSGFTVSGPGPSGCGSIGYGIVVRDGAHAYIHDNKILDIRDEPFSGCQNGVGIVVGRSTWSTTGTAEITDNIISGFQKNGIVVSNTGSSATITSNTVTGAGPTTVIAQNGIQVSSGANATINGNTVQNISWTLNSSWVSAGMLLYDAGTVNMSGNTLSEVQAAIYSITTDGTFDNNTITTTSTGVGNPPAGVYGLVIDGGTVTATNNPITNDGTAGGYGLAVYAGYEGDASTNVTLTGNTVSGWNTGVSFDQCETSCGTGVFTGIEFEFNEVTGNTTQVENLHVVPAVPASPNWWGSAANPGFDLDEFSFSPWCADQACTTFGYLSSEVQDALDDLDPDSTFTLTPGVYEGLVLGVPGTTLKLMDGAEIRPDAGPCFLVNADNVSIEAESPSGAVCVPPTFYDGLDLLKAVNGLRVVNMEFDGSAVNTLDGLNIGQGLTNFQFLNNYIHDFDRDGVRFTPGASPAGSMVMAGNLFAKNSGFGVNNLTPVSLTTTYNNWYDPKGPKGTYGDGYNGKQTYSPYVYADLLASSSGTSYTNKVTTTGTITYAVKVSAANVFGAQFELEYDPAKLELLSITDSGRMVHDAVCPIDTLANAQDGTINYCGKGKLLNGTITLYTLKFKVKPGTLAGTTTIDFMEDSVSFASNATGPSNFIYPGGMADVTVSIYDPATTTFNLAAQILLEGRSDSSDTCMNLGSGIVKCMTDKWGNLSLDNLPAGSYVVKVSKLGYIDLPATLNKILVVNAGKISVGKLTLVAGDVDNNEVINLADAVAVANEWGRSGSAIVNPLADINADGKVDLLDLAIVAKNYNKTSSVYNSWKP